jgi:hypothetical protein
MYKIKRKIPSEDILWCKQSGYDLIDLQYNSREIDFKWWYIIWKILTDFRFRRGLRHTILYAFRWENFIRGYDSSDIFLFKSNHAKKIFIIKDEL